MKSLNFLATVFVLGASSAIAQTAAADHNSHHVAQASPMASAEMAEGEVRKVDKDAGKLTLRHGPIASLDMPAMTMVFRAGDPKMLDEVKAGDKVRFAAANVSGALTVTKIEVVK
jgi:Cu/Ag efflux protein CusF